MADAQLIRGTVRPPLRLATPDDLTTVLALIHDYFTFDRIPFDESAVASGLRTLLARPELGAAFLIGHGAAPAGYLIVTYGFDLEFGGAQATVTDLYLGPHQRGLGLGAAALTALEHFCLERGVLPGPGTSGRTTERPGPGLLRPLGLPDPRPRSHE